MNHNLTPKHPQEHFQDEEVRDYVLTGGGAWVDTGGLTSYIRYDKGVLLIEAYALNDLSAPIDVLCVIEPKTL